MFTIEAVTNLMVVEKSSEAKGIRAACLSYIESDASYKFICDFQQICGVGKDGKVKSFFVYYYFKLCSTAGEEIFGLMPLLFWYLYAASIPLISSFGFFLVCGQLMKEFAQLPRPGNNDKYKVAKLEQHFDTEFGFPSTHTMSGLLPMAISFGLTRQDFDVPNWFWIFSTVYAVSVAASRIYLGVHSLLDVIGGAAIGVALLAIAHLYGDPVETMLYESKEGIYYLVLTLVLYLTVYPKARPWNANYGTTAQIYGTWIGVSSALWFSNNCAPALKSILLHTSVIQTPRYHLSALQLELLAEMSTSAYSPVVAGVLRFVVAAAITAAAKVFTKKLAMPLFLHLQQYDLLKPAKDEEIDLFGRKVEAAKAYNVEVPVRLINYGLLGWAVVVVTPWAWRTLNLV